MMLQHNIATYIACHAIEMVGIVVSLTLKKTKYPNMKVNETKWHKKTEQNKTALS